MGKARIISHSHKIGLYQVVAYEADCLERKIQKINENHEAIEQLSPTIYTDEKDGVQPQFDIRADKWDLAQNAMDRVNRERIAKGIQAELPKADDKNTQGGASKDAGLPS